MLISIKHILYMLNTVIYLVGAQQLIGIRSNLMKLRFSQNINSK